MRGSVLAVAGAAIVVASVVAVWIADARRGHDRRVDVLEARLTGLDAQLADLVAAAESDATEEWHDLEQRIARIEVVTAREPVVAAPPAEEAQPATNLAADASPDPPEADDLAGLLAQVTAPDFDWSSGNDALRRFYALARESTWIDDHIATLEGEVAMRPDDVDARMDLASLYLGKLFTAQGPEQALWGGRAEAQWKEASALDPEHWESRFRLGTSYAYYPDVMGKTDDAIRLLEEARSIQERQPADARRARTYVSLARLYERRGDGDAAARVLETGAAFHPDDEEIRRTVGSR